MTILFPGSFDPVTLGHLDLIKRGAQLFDHIIVAVLHNPTKQPLFTVQERVKMLQIAVEGIPNVQIESYSGLLVEYAKKQGVSCVLRGVRSTADCAYEIPMAIANHQISTNANAISKNEAENVLTGYKLTGIETILLITSPAYAHISAGLVREVAAAGYGNAKSSNSINFAFDDKILDQWVLPTVKDMLRNKYL
ncbi:MAG: pantetheine-phosphate adenylyltransferase [Defluviitaleaceae bacterium]|nr:pantetheine-phosphate adenylyltransferase [Defluviitaleaceae bacterium]